MPVDQPLMEAGLDSIASVELRNAVAAHFQLDLPATATFDYPTITALAGFLLSRQPAGTAGAAPPTAATDLSALQKVTTTQHAYLDAFGGTARCPCLCHSR